MKRLLAVLSALFVPTLVAGQQPARKKPDRIEVRVIDSRPALNPMRKLDTLDASFLMAPRLPPGVGFG